MSFINDIEKFNHLEIEKEQNKMENKYPDLTQQAIEVVDSTPDNEYPIRILQAYRENCNCKWATDTDGNCDNALFSIMNEHCEQRAKIPDEAIKLLIKNLN